MPPPGPSSQSPDDWQQLAAQHRQQQFEGNVQRLGKQARRGNRLAGGCLMMFGLLALLIGPLSMVATRRARWEDFLDDPEPFLYVIGGAMATLGLGFAVWRGRDRAGR